MSKRIRSYLLCSVLIFFLLFCFFVRSYYIFLKDTVHISLFKTLFSNNSLKSFNNRINFLILGIPGGNHEGPNLSDSITVASYNNKTNQVAMISIPRDIWSDTLKDKINTAYAYGEEKRKGGGFILAKAEVEAIIGIPIHYALVVDFNKFTELIDFLGGITVDIEKSFTDYKFPIEGKENDLCNGDSSFACRYETVSFKKGLTFMDGKTALNYVRSRQAEGTEGSDFARTKRQQKVIDAIKIKLLTVVKSCSLDKMRRLYDVLDRLVGRDISNQQVAIVLKYILLNGRLKQKSIILSNEFFIVPDYSEYDGKYVLVPTSANFTSIHQYIVCNLLEETTCEDLKKK